VPILLVLLACACRLRPERREPALAPEGWLVLEAEPSCEGWAHAVRDPRTQVVFLLVAPGTFQMGSSQPGRGWLHERGAAHEAVIPRPLYLGRTELTQAQWERLMGSNPSRWKGDGLPVKRVSWNDAMGFCRHPVRGGSWRCGSIDPTGRDLTVATATEDDLGFRVARSLP